MSILDNKKEVMYGIVVTCTTPSLLENENCVIFPEYVDRRYIGKDVPVELRFDNKPYNKQNVFFLNSTNWYIYEFTTEERKIKKFLSIKNAKKELEKIENLIKTLKKHYNFNVNFNVEIVEISLSFKKYKETI